MIRHIFLLWGILLFCGNTGYSYGGGGFELSLSGYRQLGMGYTGIATAFDSYAVYLNPGAMGFIKYNYIQLGASFVKPSTTFRAQNFNTQSFAAESENMDSVLITPISLFATWRKPGSRFTYGIGVHSPFGYKTRWDDDWKGKSIVQESSVNSLYIQPTVSYRIDDRMGVGIGFVYSLGNFLIRKSLPIIGKNNTGSWVEIGGSGNGIGYNIGFFFRPNPRFSLGVNYRSGVDITIDEGTLNFNVPVSQLNEYKKDSVFNSTLPLPGIFSVGMSYQLRNDLIAAIDINVTRWNVYDEIPINLQNPDVQIRDVDDVIDRNFKNSLAVRLGVEYQMNPTSYLRFGAIYNQSPVKEDYVSPELPDVNKIAMTLGYGRSIFNHFQIDIAYKFEYSPETFGEFQQKNFSGLYETFTNVLGVGVSYVF